VSGYRDYHRQAAVADAASDSELKEIGAKPERLSLEDTDVPEITKLLTSNKPDGILFAAGAGGKGDPGRTRKVDFEGAVKVYDAMEAANVKRLVLIGALDIRDRSKGWPEWYNDDDSQSCPHILIRLQYPSATSLIQSEAMSDRMWGAIGPCQSPYSRSRAMAGIHRS
jgi:nucleoside-diphosphate-sugar epimerase